MKERIKYILGKAVMMYFSVRHMWPIWYYVLNYRARRLYRAHAPALDPVQTRIVNDLKEKGIAITHIDELFPNEHLLSVFQSYVRQFEGRAKTKGTKPFLRYFFDPVPVVDFSNPFFKFAVHPRILAIINSYLDMWTEFYFLSLNRTLPMGEGALPIKSQRWHRDFEDKKMCKMFIYLTDVDTEAGPFIYTEQSAYGQRFGKLFPQKPPMGSYPQTEDVERLIPREYMKMETGLAGTILFCNTAGVHRGGYATTKERVMFTAGYRSKASPSETRYRLAETASEEIQKGDLDPATRAAIVVRPHSRAFKLFKRVVNIPEYY